MAIDWRALRESLVEYEADPRSQLAGIQDLIQRCQDGIETQVNTARGDIVEVTQRRPEIELQARKLLKDVANDILDRAEAQERETSGESEAPRFIIELVEAIPD